MKITEQEANIIQEIGNVIYLWKDKNWLFGRVISSRKAMKQISELFDKLVDLRSEDMMNPVDIYRRDLRRNINETVAVTSKREIKKGQLLTKKDYEVKKDG